MRSQSFPHVELFIAIGEVANEFRIRMVIEMTLKVQNKQSFYYILCSCFRNLRSEVVHTRKKLSAELTRHILCSVRLNVLL